MRRYRLQRRLIGRVYQTANVVKFEAAVDDVIKQVIARLEALDGDEIDLKEWMHIIAVECLGASVLSWSPGLLKAGTDWGSSAHSYLGWRRKSVMGLFPTLTKLTLRSNLFEWIFRDVWDLKYVASPNFRSFFPVRCKHSTTLPPRLLLIRRLGRCEAHLSKDQICLETEYSQR